MNLKDNKSMGFIENLRQWASEGYDKLTDQQNTYHQSTGKTQKEYEQDIDFYKRLEDATSKSATVLGTIDGAALGLGSALSSTLPLWTKIISAVGDAYIGNVFPYIGTLAEKQLDMQKNEPEKYKELYGDYYGR